MSHIQIMGKHILIIHRNMKQIITNVVFSIDANQTFLVEYIQMRVKVFKSMEGI